MIRHVSTPLPDGYRTPTIEDIESNAALRAQLGDSIPGPESSAQRSPSYFPQLVLAPTENESSEEKEKQKAEETTPRRASRSVRLSIKQRIKHFTWAWFTVSMATGGIANVIYAIPFRFPGLYAIGCIFLFLNIVIFLLVATIICLRFHWHAGTFHTSFTHPTESLFMPAAIVSVGTILMNISQYGIGEAGYWLNTTVMSLFWIYCAAAIVLSCGIYLVLWSTQTFTIAQMTPIWVFPAYPLLIVGPHAGVLSASLPPYRAVSIILGGFTLQAIGFMVSLMIYSAFIYRLMTQKLPREPIRPGMFVSVGPAGFTVSGIVSMASNLDRALPPDFMGDGKMAAFVLRVVGNFMGIWLWGLTLWFFFVSVGAHFNSFRHGDMPFALTWYSFVFPQTAMTTATLGIGKAFNARPVQIIGCIMAVIVICLWIFVFYMNLRAVFLGQLLLPQRGEDRDEGGFRRDMEEKRHAEEKQKRDESATRTGGLARRATFRSPARPRNSTA